MCLNESDNNLDIIDNNCIQLNLEKLDRLYLEVIIMAGRRVQYQIVGRYMDGTSVTGYQMQSIETGKSGKFTREQAAFLVGRGQVTNCDASIYQDKVIFKGIGVSLESLPIIRDGKVSNTDRIGHVRRDVTPEQAVNQLMISGVIVSGRNTVGYVIRNAGGQEKKIKREDCLKLASQNRLGNARIQNYNGKVILRGVGVNLNEIPVINVGKENQAGANAGAGQANAGAGQTGAGQRARKKIVYYGAQENVNLALKRLKKRGPGVPIKGIDTLLKGVAERVNSFQDLRVAGYTYNASAERGQSGHDCAVEIPFLIKQDSGDTTKVMGVEIIIFTKNSEIKSVLSTYIDDKAHSQKTAGYDSTLGQFNNQYFDRSFDEADSSKGLDYQNMEYAIQIIQNTIVTYALAELRQNDIQKPENVFDVEKYMREERARKQRERAQNSK